MGIIYVDFIALAVTLLKESPDLYYAVAKLSAGSSVTIHPRNFMVFGFWFWFCLSLDRLPVDVGEPEKAV